MPFSDEGNALIKNLTPVQRIRFMEDADRICGDKKWNNRAFKSLLKTIRETKSTDRRHRCGRPKHGRTEENVTTDHC